MSDATQEGPIIPYRQLPTQTNCPKCAAPRNHEKWPHGILYFSPEGSLEVNHPEIADRLLVACGRCQYRWAEPAGDLELLQETPNEH